MEERQPLQATLSGETGFHTTLKMDQDGALGRKLDGARVGIVANEKRYSTLNVIRAQAGVADDVTALDMRRRAFSLDSIKLYGSRDLLEWEDLGLVWDMYRDGKEKGSWHFEKAGQAGFGKSGGDRPVIRVYAFLQMLLPFLGFFLVAMVPAILFARFRGMRGTSR